MKRKVWLATLLLVISLGARADHSELHTWGQQMKAALFDYESTGDPNHDYANVLSAQYRLAAEKSAIMMDRLENVSLQRVARSAISKIDSELADIETWKGRNSEPRSGDDAEAVADALAALKGRMSESSERIEAESDPDKYFGQIMVWHHETAIALGQMVVNRSVDAQLRMLATDTVRRHTREIGQLRNWEVQN